MICHNPRCTNEVPDTPKGKSGPKPKHCTVKCTRSCVKAAWVRLNPIKRQDAARRLRYGITGDQFRVMDAAQSGLCAICNQPPTNGRWKRRLDIDHNHITGKVRGLLCWNCNRLLGTAHENPDTLRRAAEYLEKWNNG